MPTGARGSDTTGSQFPDGQQPFKGREASPEEKVGEDVQQRDTSDTTEDSRAEPADAESDESESGWQPDVGEEADTTAEEPTAGETDAGDEASDVDGEAEREPEPSREDEDVPSEDPEGETGEDEMDVPFKYHGTEPDNEEHEDYVFISGVDPDQRYEDTEDLIHAHENLLEHQERQHEQIQNLQDTLANERAEKEGDMAEMKAKLNVLEENLDEDDLTAMLADRYMPEEFQGMSKDDVPASQQEEFIRARTKAELKAEEELEQTQSARQEAQETAQERQERIQHRIDEATQRLDEVDAGRLGLSDQEAEKYVPEALSEMSPEGSEKNAFDVAHRLYAMNELVPDEVGFSDQDAEMAFDLLIDAVGARARQLKQEEMQSRSEKIQKKQSRSQSRATPEPATGESASREPGRPTETFRKA